VADRRPAWRDPFFAACLLAGPTVWALLIVVGVPRPAGHPPLPLLITSVLVAPVLEEWVFRGLLQGWLLERARLARSRLGLSGANLLTSMTFVAAHLWSRSAPVTAAVLAPSLVLGACRERYGTIWPGVAVHMVWNAGFVWSFAPA